MLSTSLAPANSDAFSRLAFALRRAKADGQGAALLLGAGCSLTSARHDVSTTSILRDIIAEVQPSEAHADDASLYRLFVKHWRNLSPRVRLSLVRERLDNLEPSGGYLALRRLVELGYVTHIVTTNFDLLIDKVLEGLPLAVRVGQGAWRPAPPHGGDLGLIKVHGDIHDGELRFDPKDLDQLPRTIRTEIRRFTLRPTLVCGFRGQDRGLMEALSVEGDHPAFWSSPEFPDAQQDYLYDRLDAWMRERSSSANYICGPLGRFDGLMEALVETLTQAPRPLASKRMPTVWTATAVGRLISRNSRIEELFAAFLQSSETFFSTRIWKSQPPSFALSYRTALETYAALLVPGGIINLFAATLGNEIDALFLAMVVEISARACGWPHALADLVEGLRAVFARDHPTLDLDKGFWSELLRVLKGEPGPVSADFRLRLNNSNRLSMIGAGVPVRALGLATAHLTAIAAMSTPADVEAADVSTLWRAKRVALAAAQSLVVHGDKVRLNLGKQTSEVFQEVVSSYLAALPGGRVLGDGQFDSESITVETTIVGLEPSRSMPPRATNLVTAVMERATRFDIAAAGEDWAPVVLAHDVEIKKFLASAAPAALLVGPSGAGKSTSLRTAALRNPSWSAIVLDGRAVDLEKSVSQSFFGADLLPDPVRLGSFVDQLDTSLRLRRRGLLLALDGLNEAADDPIDVAGLFRTLMVLAETLFERGATNIKLLAASQERTLRSLLEGQERPVSGVFYRPGIVNADARAEPLIKMRALTVDEQRAIVVAGFPADVAEGFAGKLQRSAALHSAFDQPILLRVASQLADRGVDALAATAPALTFAHYANLLLARAAAASSPLASESVVRSYFELLLDGGAGARVQRFVLLQRAQLRLGAAAHGALRALEDVGVFQIDPSGLIGYVAIRHERLQVALLANYLEACSSDPVMFAHLLNRSQQSQMLLDALLALLTVRGAANPEEDAFLNAFFSRNLEQIPWLASVIATAILDSFDPKMVATLLFRFSRRAGTGGPGSLARAIARGLLALTRQGRHTRKACNAVLDYTSGLPAGRASLAELHLAASLAAYDEDLSVEARESVDLARGFLTERRDAKLSRQVDLHRAKVIGRWESRARALEILRGQFADVLDHGPHDALVECTLEFGEMLRDAALFDEAIAVYRRAQVSSDGTADILMRRVALGEAVAIKNKMQLVLRDARRSARLATTDEVDEASLLFQEAMPVFDAVADWARTHEAIGLMLAALSERSEASIILSWARPELRAAAYGCLGDLEKGLGVQEVVTHRVEWGRQRARLAEMEGHFAESLADLAKARATAQAVGQAYNVCDCDYQIGRLALYASLRGDGSLVTLGIEALNQAAEYLERETGPGNVYITDVVDIRRRLIGFL